MKQQTISFLRERLRQLGIQPATRHGQNFLIDGNLQRLIVSTGEITPDDVILEVGVGTGLLTGQMAQQAGEIIGVEIDQHLYELASEELLDFDNVTLLYMDALKNKNRFDDRVLDTVRGKLAEDENRRFKLVANLPYNIATPILSNLLYQDPLPDLMVATIQKELADRIVAKPWTKDYSALSIWMQAQCNVEIIRIMPPSVFWPSPKVESAIIRIEIDREKRAAIPDPLYFHQFVKAIFFHRRKFLRMNLLSAMKGRLGKPEVDAIMTEMELGADARSEQLEVELLIRLCEAFRKKVPDWKL